jgi:hypothetical protein
VQQVIFRRSPEKMEVKVGNRVFLVVFHPFPEQECVNISGFDISDQKEIEEKSLESKKKYQELFNLIEQAVQISEMVFDEKGQPIDYVILDVNIAYEKHSGLRREEVIGRHVKEILPIVKQTWLERYGKVVRAGMGMHFEEYNASLDKWFEVFASPMGGNRFVTVFSDITRRKQVEKDLLCSEQHYRLLYETMLQGVVYQDASCKIISMNPAAERILGKVPTEFLGSSSVGEEHLTIRENGSTFPGSEHPAMVSLRTGREIQNVVMGVYNPQERRYRWININAIPIFQTGEDKPFQVYTVFDDITERKRKEHRMLRYNRILKGINLIFSNRVEAKTEEEPGNVCLSVALELTGSQFGFVGELGADGILHDIAISDMGWSQYLMYDKTRHRRPPGDFILPGLYGSIIDSSEGFFVNDLQSHPESIGLPPGHPPLTSFLGVPLLQEGVVVGIIAVANREGGYSYEQQEDLEAIAPAMMQALQRKREEQERMKAEEALSRERSLLESVMQTTDVMLVLLDLQFNFLWVNSAYAETCQMKSEEMVGMNHFALYPNAENEAIFRRVRDTGKGVFYKDKPFIFPDQADREVTYWDWSLSPVKDSGGDIKGLVFSLREATKYKKVEEALQKSEEELAIAQKISQIGSWTWNLITNELTWSEQLYRNYGLEPGEVKPTYELFLSFIVPEDREKVDRGVQEAIESGHKYSGTHNIIRRDGVPRVLLSENEIITDESGKAILIHGINQDITEQKRVEEALKKARDTLEEKVKERTAELEEAYDSLLENEMRLNEAQKIAHLGNWDWDLLTDKLYWSDEIYRIFQLDPLEITPTHDEFLSYIDPNDRDIVYYSIQRALKRELFSVEYRINIPDGQRRIVHSQGEIIFNEKGFPVRMRGTLQDITERKMAEEALERMDKIRIKEIHHRIKNNLQIISSLLDLQAESFEDKKVIEAFREGQNRVISMSLIHEELYKGEGTGTLDFSAYLKKLVENLFKTYNLSSKNISLSMYLEENTFFDMDTAVPLGIIVNELISNSLKHAFIEKQDGKIQIRFCREEKDHEMDISFFSLTISDDGKGLPQDLELESVESLGLQLVNILVDQLDGELELKRAQGTEFTIKFKVVEKDNKALYQ